MVLTEYTYVFVIGLFFTLLEAYNNGANDVANAWATSVSSRSVTYQQAMVLCLIFELLGALTVGARTASTIKNGIIPIAAFNGNASVQLLAFTCAAAGASIWVMWCTRHSAHVSSTYSLISSIAGVGVAAVGASKVQWGWNKGTGLGAIFSGLIIAPAASAAFGAVIFMLIKLVVHMRKDSTPWAVWTSPFFFLIAGTICTLSIVYKGSPNLNLAKKPEWYIASVTLGVGFGLFVLSAIFFVPYVHAKVIKKDHTLRWYHVFQGPLLFKRPTPSDGQEAKVPNYAVIQHNEEVVDNSSDEVSREMGYSDETEKGISTAVVAQDLEAADRIRTFNAKNQTEHQILLAEATERHHAELRKQRGPLGWAMRKLHDTPMGAGSLHEWRNIKTVFERIPAQVVVGLLYGASYDIHRAQIGIAGTPEGKRMAKVYGAAKQYPNETEYLYSFVQIISACTASFAHGSNDVGNAVGVFSAIYSTWHSGKPVSKTNPVELWQIAVIALTICFGFVTYGYNIMKVMGNRITFHSPSRGCSMELASAIVVMIFSLQKLPVSTSMCITGATVGVGLCNGTWRAVNFHRVMLLFISWVITIPVAGLIGGLMMGILLNTPHF